ncbi:MAG: AAA family ATPase [Oliverpabstia sp.]
MEKFVVTITRQFGSLGRPVAKRMSEILGIEYYDRDIVDQAAKKLKLPVSVINQEEEKAAKPEISPFSRMMFPLGKGTSSTQDSIFEAQKNIIEFLAEKNSCIIVGRCSDFILGDEKNSMHIYIYASYEARLKHCIEDLGMEEAEARRMIKSVDEARNSYHMQYAGYLPDDKRFKDILIDSSLFGVEGTAEFLAEAVRKKFM